MQDCFFHCLSIIGHSVQEIFFFQGHPFLLLSPNNVENMLIPTNQFEPSIHIIRELCYFLTMITILVFTTVLNLFGEYFQFIRMLVKHCGLNRKNTNKEDCRAESEQGEEWGTKKFSLSWRGNTMTWFPKLGLNPLSTTPPSPRVPPAGLLPPLQLPGPGHCQAGYLLPGEEQKLVNILPSATSWLRLEKISPHLPGNLRSPG